MTRPRRPHTPPQEPARDPSPTIATDAYGPDPIALCERLRRYVGFTEKESRLLASFYPMVEPQLPRIIEDFYDRIEGDPEARRVLTGGTKQIERLKATLGIWLQRTLRGPHDAEFACLQAAIGARHVQVGLDQSFMVSGMNVFREHLTLILFRTHPKRSPRTIALQRAFIGVLDLSLALMLETYRVDWLRKILQTEQNATFKRLASIGEVAAVIAHEIRNPLAAISGAIQVLGQDMTPDAPRHHVLGEILGEIRRLDERVNDLLTYARPAVPNREMVDPLDLIRTTIRLLSGDPLMDKARIVISGDRRLPPFPMDAHQIQQVIVNLVQNAMHAIDGKGTVHVTARRIREGGIEISVEDSGPGVRQDLAEAIFRPFFSTRARGTGLGLAISRKIVESHEGTLQIDLSHPKGARFVITLPVPVSLRSYSQMR
jgi:signal transduction histidine kinase